ncbi:MAG TPA: S49 family peptidase, partial [Phototrophicaceae bacterium]|nr:S49 family peptidase [Phototrophicaceae bacterium]
MTTLLKRFTRNFPPLRLIARNRLRRRFRHLDYLLLTLPGSMPALPEQRSWLLKRIQGAPPLSLWELDRIFRRIAADPRPNGVILRLSTMSMPLADLQTLRGSIQRLRAQGKRVICYAQNYDLSQYYVASAADEIWLQPGGQLLTVGLHQEALFLKDALGMIGVELDVVAITPYKSAYDQFARAEPSPEGRAQVDWLLDARYELIVTGIAEGRRISTDAARTLIDTSPHVDADALTAGYVDAVLNEEDFAARLNSDQLVLWKDADKQLLLQRKPRGDQHVALIQINGLMMQGESADPPVKLPIPFVGGARAGDLTVVRQVRSVMRDPNVGAVVLSINSGGGAAVAAEAMTSALEQLAKKCPLVVSMNAVAGSGGYYVATPARWIVAQPATLTGSIGVISAKAVTAALRQQYHLNTVHFRRGANAGIFSDTERFSDAQRDVMRHTIEAVYKQF